MTEFSLRRLKQRVRKIFLISEADSKKRKQSHICLKNLKKPEVKKDTQIIAMNILFPEGKCDTILKCHITVVFITYSLWNTERWKKKYSHKNHTDYLGPKASPVVQWLRSKELPAMQEVRIHRLHTRKFHPTHSLVKTPNLPSSLCKYIA